MEIGRKKIIIGSALFVLAGSLVLFASGVSIFVKGSNLRGGNSSNAVRVRSLLIPLTEEHKNKSAESINENLDSDNDGLPDRIEKSIGTDSEKKDTDGDEYNDLEEVKNGYSPLVHSSQGKLLPEEVAALKEKIKNTDPVFYEKTFVEKNNFDASFLPRESITPTPITPSALPVVLSGPAVFTEEISLSNKNWKYSFYAPADIDMNKSRSLVIGLHGFEGKAKDYIKFWQSDADKNSFLVAVLQAYPKTYPNGATVESYPWLEISDFAKAALANVEKKYKIDENKIFLTGYSAGASSAYIIALDSGIKFRGVIPINGYLPLEAGIIDKLSNAKNINFYVVHGENDTDAKAIVDQEKILLQYGAKMEFKILPDMAHEYPAAEHENIIKWMEGLPQR